MPSSRLRLTSSSLPFFVALTLIVGLCTGQGCPNASTTDPVATPGPEGPQGPQGDPGPQGEQGLQGPAGAAGADGQLRIYGDGSAGALTIPAGSTESLRQTVATDGNFQFTDLTIESGANLYVFSGTVIRCTGACTVNGLLAPYLLQTSAGLGYNGSSPATAVYSAPHASIAGALAGAGNYGDSSAVRTGGQRATGLDEYEAADILMPGLVGGGGGAGTLGNYSGAMGGGTLVILAKGGINIGNAGLVRARGGTGINGGGGGGAGIIILASKTSITNAGTISAVGGGGGASSTNAGPGGGGGGGIIHLLAPSITAGTIDVSGGQPGSVTTNGVNISPRCGGGAGGACGGSGGFGGSVPAGATVTPDTGAIGADGFSFTTLVDPTDLF